MTKIIIENMKAKREENKKQEVNHNLQVKMETQKMPCHLYHTA